MFRNYGQNGWHKHTYKQHSHGWMLVVHLCTNTSTIFTHIVFKSWIGAIYNIQFLILRSLKDCHMHKLPLGNIIIFKFCVYVQYIYCTFWQLYLANICSMRIYLRYIYFATDSHFLLTRNNSRSEHSTDCFWFDCSLQEK